MRETDVIIFLRAVRFWYDSPCTEVTSVPPKRKIELIHLGDKYIIQNTLECVSAHAPMYFAYTCQPHM